MPIPEKLNHILDLPKINLTDRQLCDLELIMNRAFSPLEGFLDEEDYYSVISSTRLKNGTLWPIPINLDIDEINEISSNSELVLCDQYGKPIAILTVTSIYKPDKEREAQLVYGTNDISHVGVYQLMKNTKPYYIGGKVKKINEIDRLDFKDIRHTPQELQTIFKSNNWSTVIGFQTRNPLHRAHVEIIKRVAQEYDAKILLHPAVGQTREDDIDYITRIRCYQFVHNKYTNGKTFLSLLPLSMRMAGPREALLHAIIRKNYGCTHFIIGRDHAGPGKRKNGELFYSPYEAQELVKTYEDEIGIQVIPFQEVVYLENKKDYFLISEATQQDTIGKISGTEFRKRLIQNQEIPEWFSFPEVISELKSNIHKQIKDGLTIFFTGLPSAGKSTLAKLLYFKLLEIQNKKITLLDGDVVRQNLSKGLGFSKEDRITNITRVGYVANEITKYGGIAICSLIAPYESARQSNRNLISRNGNYVEIYVSTPPIICQQRDVKHLYKKAKAGKLTGLTGIDDTYEIPTHPDLNIDTSVLESDKCIKIILDYLKTNNLIKLSQ